MEDPHQYALDADMRSAEGMLQPPAITNEERLRWLHSQGSNDVDGYEWGIYRVKWEYGRAVEVWQTAADMSDLDEAIRKSKQS